MHCCPGLAVLPISGLALVCGGTGKKILEARWVRHVWASCAGLRERGALPELCVNDLELAAFDVLPSLLQLKERLRDESDGRFTSVFMTGIAPLHRLLQSGCSLQSRLKMEICLPPPPT